MLEKKAKLIIVNGLPASGKTTLASFLSQELNIPVFHKDTFKEVLSDSTGVVSMRGSQRFNKPSYALLFHSAERLIRHGIPVILEGNFSLKSASRTENIALYIEKLREQGVGIIEIFCTARGDLLVERFKARHEDGIRHPIHPNYMPKSLVRILEKNRFKPLGIGETLVVDTSDKTLVPYEDIKRFIQERLYAKSESSLPETPEDAAVLLEPTPVEEPLSTTYMPH